MIQPRISVIVPVYNVEKYLSKCLDSILAQDFDDYEIIAVNDGSTDNCGAILYEYSKKYPDKIIVLNQENAGQGEARNNGIKASRADYVFFVDSDDYIEHNTLSILYSELLKNNCDIAVCGTRLFDSNGKTLMYEIDKIFPFHTKIKVDECNKVITASPGPCNKLIKKSLFTENNVFFPSKVWYEDFRTIPKILALANTVAFTDKCLYNYYQRQGSTMHNACIARNYEIIDAMDDLINFFKSKDLFDKCYSELEFMTVRSVLWDSSVRVLKATFKHPILKQLKDYTLSNFPNAFSNRYFKKFINENKIMRMVVLFCLRHRLYFVLHLILKIKG